MEAERKNSPTLSKSKQPVKTEWGSQSVVFTYFQGDLNSVIDEHFSRALSNAKNPQDLSTKHKSEDVTLKNDSHMSPHQWNFSSHWTKSYQSSPATNTSNSDLNLSAATIDHHQASVLRNPPIQPADLWHFPSIANPSLTESGYPRSLPDPQMVQGPMSDGKYGSLLDFLQQERCPASSQESIVKQSSSSACITGSARLQNMSQSLTPGGERKASSYQSPGNPSITLASSGIQSQDRRRDLYF
uniref:Vestigial like family member 1 n=1 Tax=Chrysemys picta bellii TaxID=8478 RepID=A0A8C3ITC8_CHRPI|nr:transcription cofactor vestigial-like protein 1 isoform X1 [Chrysemys picta bellii]XP_042707075.1 transcription cofactor vestigial-like protein 1 isoform X1 [Chrysemys picta bellii]XP_042707076.1 transcription cofactor vestigial-like protein 1 isoform X1 [Chrysemys picta bellii]